MAVSAEHKLKFAALHRQWWRFQVSEKFSSGLKNSKQTNKKSANSQKKVFTCYQKQFSKNFCWNKISVIYL